VDIEVDPYSQGNTLWVTGTQLFIYDRRSGRKTYFLPDSEDPTSILGQGIYSITFDDSGLMWVGGTRGLNLHVPGLNQIRKFPNFTEEFDKDASYIYEDSKHHLWIATFGSELIHFDRNMKVLKRYNSVPVDEKSSLSTFQVTIMLEDSDGNMWIGTENKGLFVIENETEKLLRCQLIDHFINITPENIRDIFEDSQNNLWVATNGGVFLRAIDQPLSEFKLFVPEGEMLYGYTEQVFEDSHGWLWFGTYFEGVYCRPAELKNTREFIIYNHEPDNQNSLSHEAVWVIYEDTDGDVWFGTENGLNRFVREERYFERYTFDPYAGANFIWDMTGDSSGNLWITTEGGLFKFISVYAESGEQRSYTLKKVLPYNDIHNKRIIKAQDERIYIPAANFSGNGYFSFHPDSLSENQTIPPVFITDFSVRNEPYKTDSNIIIKKHIFLQHHQNFFSFKFAALDYSQPDENQYAYYLEGLEDDWVYCNNRQQANYTSVPPGDYVFRVKGSNNDGYWNETGAYIRLTILPPLWKTWWAYMSYGILTIAIVFVIIRYYNKRQQLLHSLELKQVQAEKLEELDKMRSHFFANISHEFRTPLTLILGPLRNLITKISDKETASELSLMQRNAQRLQNLINQLLSISRLESGKMKLRAREENIITLVRQYFQSFESYAKQKNIELNFEADKEEIKLYVDKEKMENILYNLLSNAFKFTPAGRQITVSVRINQSKDFTVISIADTGKGIAAEHLTHIFDRFYQVEDPLTKGEEGTGIGLALVKELVELHHGDIEVESIVGKGTTFSVVLPLGREHLKDEEISNEQENMQDRKSDMVPDHKIQEELKIWNVQPEPENKTLKDRSQEGGGDNPLLLIVEDNRDLRHYMRGFLGEMYEIIECGNGQTGFEIALETIPDLVISDVMMPVMDGYEFCQRLKTDNKTSHIPVIFLTARADMVSKIEGLEAGADDFITKPFDSTELLIRIRNLINQRARLHEKFNRSIKKFGIEQTIGIDAPDLTSMDQKFLQKAIDIVHKYLSDSEYSVDSLAVEMSLSTRQLQRKMQSITGNSPLKFIRAIRLSRAAEMLAGKTGTVSEIAFEVGFNNLSWFARSFKEYFGVLPSEYKVESPED
jgi:signal transduction histidine kinase/DNA-binding response OmpR family regulator/streptogramin lyase